jgi:hypothetical protein
VLQPTGGWLLRHGLFVVLVLLHARGFRPVLARDWHGPLGQSAWELACHERFDLEFAGQVRSWLVWGYPSANDSARCIGQAAGAHG